MHDLLVSLTRLLNHLFGAPLGALLQALGIHLVHPNAPINTTLTLELVIAVAMLLFFILTRLSLNVERPGTAQNLAEVVHEFVSNQADSTIGTVTRSLCPTRPSS